MAHAHVLLAHPERRSLNGALFDASCDSLAAAGYSVSSSDLYGLDFDAREGPHHYRHADELAAAGPERFDTQSWQREAAKSRTLAPHVRREIDFLSQADLLVVHFPLWWFGPPAIFKGWMDRVFVYGEMYRSRMRYDAGRFRGRHMLACVTLGAPASFCGPDGREGNARMHLFPILYPFRYLGYNVLEPELFFGIGSSDSRDHGAELGKAGAPPDAASAAGAIVDHWRGVVTSLDARARVAFHADTDFDAAGRLRAGVPHLTPFIQRTET
ncbi:MAG: NAD(P)H-dependent oxidoreductase [Pseudomonadota bacterium]